MMSWLPTYGRLDQLVALLLGASCGACILAGRARHRRDPVLPAAGAGILLGGVAGLAGTSVGLRLHAGVTPVGFVIERLATWGLMAGLVAAALSTFARTRRLAANSESFLLGVLGGVTAGALFSLPGPSEVWLPIAMTWCGGAMGFAAVGPGIWHAPAVVHVLPVRGARHSLWSLHERAIDEGWSMPLAEAQVACVDGVVYVYPPPAGAILDGVPLYRAMPIVHDAMLAVGRSRFRVTLGRSS